MRVHTLSLFYAFFFWYGGRGEKDLCHLIYAALMLALIAVPIKKEKTGWPCETSPLCPATIA